MSRKSNVVNLGLVYANEASNEGMVEIMKFVHQYIHEGNDGEKAVFGGDQLTCEGATGVQRLRKTSIDKDERLQDFLPTAEDWHTKMTMLTVSQLYILLNVTQIPPYVYCWMLSNLFSSCDLIMNINACGVGSIWKLG